MDCSKKSEWPESVEVVLLLEVHKNETFFGSDFEFYTISLLVMREY